MAQLVDRVSIEARALTPPKVAKTLVMLPFYLIGGIVGILWFVLVFAWTAMIVGFRDASRRPSGSR